MSTMPKATEVTVLDLQWNTTWAFQQSQCRAGKLSIQLFTVGVANLMQKNTWIQFYHPMIGAGPGSQLSRASRNRKIRKAESRPVRRPKNQPRTKLEKRIMIERVGIRQNAALLVVIRNSTIPRNYWILSSKSRLIYYLLHDGRCESL